MTTLTELIERREKAYRALMKAMEAQKIQVGQGGNSRSVERPELAQIRATIADFDRQIAAMTPGARRGGRIVPGGC